MEQQHPILFYDGSCAFCSFWVGFIARHDRKKKFRFASLSGSTAKDMGVANSIQNADSVVLFHNGHLLIRSRAVWKLLDLLWPELWPLWRMGGCIPLRMADATYEFIARNRYRLGTSSDSCSLHNRENQPPFLP
jgi:predicted DCC family thiol-disulfide oxidoreductase YuxK